MTAKRGRPRLALTELRSALLSCRITEPTSAALSEASKATGLTRSLIAEIVIVEGLRRRGYTVTNVAAPDERAVARAKFIKGVR